jgi:hypothetical protein
MGLNRPKPAPRTAVDSEVKSVLLRGAQDGLVLGRNRIPSISDHEIWHAYTAAQLLPPQLDVALAEVGRRYGIDGLDAQLYARLRTYVEQTEVMGLAPYAEMANQQMGRAASAIGATTALDLLPDQEFLTAYQDALQIIERRGREGQARAEHMREHADRVFKMYGLPYQMRDGEIVWAGDQVTRSDVVEPALTALEDGRVTGARAEFLQARAALRGGTPDSLRDATHEAANAVEAVLHALIVAHGLQTPRAKTAAPLFNVLRDGGVLPPSLESTVMAAPHLRNAQGGHTQGPTVADADQRLAAGAVSAAAVAITALVAYLP